MFAEARMPADVRAFMQVYVHRLGAELPGAVHGVYLYGSTVLEAFVEARSDLDFMAVLNRPMTAEELRRLCALHRWLNRKEALARRMEGHYCLLQDLRQGILTRRYPAFADGRYLGLQKVMRLYWYQLRKAGLRVWGPEPGRLFPDVGWEEVRQEMRHNLNGYWMGRAGRRFEFMLDSSVEFAVLTVCRIVYTLERQQVITKEQAGECALDMLPGEWHRLIREALRLREGAEGRSLYPSRLGRAKETKGFIAWVTGWCNEAYFNE